MVPTKRNVSADSPTICATGASMRSSPGWAVEAAVRPPCCGHPSPLSRPASPRCRSSARASKARRRATARGHGYDGLALAVTVGHVDAQSVDEMITNFIALDHPADHRRARSGSMATTDGGSSEPTALDIVVSGTIDDINTTYSSNRAGPMVTRSSRRPGNGSRPTSSTPATTPGRPSASPRRRVETSPSGRSPSTP